jgi:hypothetical protein
VFGLFFSVFTDVTWNLRGDAEDCVWLSGREVEQILLGYLFRRRHPDDTRLRRRDSYPRYVSLGLLRICFIQRSSP